MSGTLDHDAGAAPAEQLLDLAAQVQRLAPPAGYDAALFAREMAELGAEISAMAAHTSRRLADLAEQVRRLDPPARRDPEKFWRDKSDLAARIAALGQDAAAQLG